MIHHYIVSIIYYICLHIVEIYLRIQIDIKFDLNSAPSKYGYLNFIQVCLEGGGGTEILDFGVIFTSEVQIHKYCGHLFEKI